METAVKVKGRLSLIEQIRLIKYGIIYRIFWGTVLVNIQPVFNTLNGNITCQICFEVVRQQTFTAASHIEVKETGCHQITGAAREGTSKYVVLCQCFCCCCKFFPCGRYFQIRLLKQVGSIPHDLCMGI